MIARSDFKLVLRSMRAEDWEQLHAMREEESVRYNTLAIPFSDPGRFKERAINPSSTDHRLVAEAIFRDDMRKIVGMLGLHRGRLSQASSAGMGIQVGTDYQGMGVGTALMVAMCDLADNWLNLHRVELEVFTDNERGIALYKKFSFEIEVTLRRFALRDGGYTDAYRMGRINPHHVKSDTP